MHLVNLETLELPLNDVQLKGDISIPQNAHSLVIFAHGSGSSRLSPRNQMVASYLNEHDIATFLFDLLTHDEDRNYENRFNIALLAQRLKEATRWIEQQKDYSPFRIGYFGASTGAAAALIAASELPQIAAVVSRGGRPDLAMIEIPLVKAPTLFIVGELDTQVLELNEKAFQLLNCDKRLEVVPGATHLFEESGAMEKVCVLAANWFEMHLQPLELYG
jgi:dienelactone hydrolase